MLSLVATRGRPPKFNEPLITRHFDLPESLNDSLVKAGRSKAQADIVRDALAEYLDKSSKKTDLATELTDIKAMFEQKQAGRVCIDVGEETRQELQEFGKQFGFAEPSHFVYSLVAAAVDKSPEEVHEWILGDVTREVEKKLKEEKKAA